MNFYVYSENDVKFAFNELMHHLGRNGKNYESTEKPFDMEGVLHRFLTLGMGDCCFFYPSASLWNRKIYELLSKKMFSDVSPIDSDYFLVPITIHFGTPHTPKLQLIEFEKWVFYFIQGLPYWQYNKKKHVFFVAGDSWKELDVLCDSFVFRTSCAKNSKDLSIYYDVIINVPELNSINDCDYDCSFIGCLETHPLRRTLPIAIDKIPGKKICESTPDFFLRLSEESRRVMEIKWIETLNNSKFIMSPRGGGLNSIRFFETLAFGRIPILIADDTKLPLEDTINYNKFIVRVPEKKINDSYLYVKEFLRKNDLCEASKLARDTWNTYFSPGKLGKLLELSLPNEVKTCKYKTM